MRHESVAYPQGTGDVSPGFQAGETVMQKPPPTFLTHNEAIAGFTNQSLGLPAYACNTGSSTAIKLAPRMHQNLPLPQTPPPVGRGHLRRLDPRARHDSSPTFWTVDTPMAQVPCSRRHAGARRSMHGTKTTPSEYERNCSEPYPHRHFACIRLNWTLKVDVICMRGDVPWESTSRRRSYRYAV